MQLTWLIWLLPLFFAVHDGEEILTWNWWMERKGQHIFAFGRTGGAWASQNSRQMTVAVLVVGGLLLLGTFSGARAVSAGTAPYLFGAILAIWLGHTALHVAASLYHRMYTPGVISAILLCLPHGFLTYRALLQAGALTWPQTWLSGAAGLGVAPFMLLVAHRAGRLLTR